MPEFDIEQFRADICGATFADLRLCAEIVAEEIGVREQDALRETRDQIVAMAASVGRSVEELMQQTTATGRSRKPAVDRVVKFANPENPGTNTWSGRGKRPRWLQEALLNGAKLEDFAVAKEEAVSA